MAFTVARLADRLHIPEPDAAYILALIHREVSPFTIPAVDSWRRACYHDPDPDKPETIMRAIDVVLDTCGTEAIWGSQSCTMPVAEYCNSGDTYATTILYDYDRRCYCLTSWGDWVERYGDRYGVS